MKAFADDDSKSPPPTSFLDRLIRRYARPAYVIVVLGLYLLASTAMGLALAPAIWCWQVGGRLESVAPVADSRAGARAWGARCRSSSSVSCCWW